MIFFFCAEQLYIVENHLHVHTKYEILEDNFNSSFEIDLSNKTNQVRIVFGAFDIQDKPKDD